ncbi:MAG: hypothetical protein ABI914_03300 [Acidobacteriota bacterium]
MVAAATTARGVRLLRSDVPLDAHGERAWFSWAMRSRTAVPQLARAAGELRAGEAVWICVLDPDLDPDWVRVMATYTLSRQCVVGAGRAPFPPHLSRVELGPGAHVRVVRRDG